MNLAILLMCSKVKVVTLFYTPRERNSRRYMGITTLSVRLFVQIRPWSVTSFCFDIGITYLAHGCYTMRHPRLQYDLYLWLKGQIYRVFLTLFHVWPVTWVCFDIGISYFAHGCITLRRCVAYIHNPDTTLTFDLQVQFIRFLKWLCVRATAFSCFEIVLPYLSH